MATPIRNDDLLPTVVPKRLGLAAALLVSAVLLGMVIAAIAGGVSWLIGVGGAGTALGTLGLAYFTFAMAERTTELVGSSQRLEASAAEGLAAGRQQAESAALTAREAQQQARAAAETAREAERSRIDALAPIVDFRVDWLMGHGHKRGTTPATHFVLTVQPGDQPDPRTLDLDADLAIVFHNFGRTPAFATVKHVGAWFEGANAVIRVESGSDKSFTARVVYAGLPDDPFRHSRDSLRDRDPRSDDRGHRRHHPMGWRAHTA